MRLPRLRSGPKCFPAELNRPIRGFEVFAQPALLGMLDEREWTYIRKDGSTLDVSLARKRDP